MCLLDRCMIDGKENEQSRFLAGASEMVQKFSLGALIFKNGVSASSSQVLSRGSCTELNAVK